MTGNFGELFLRGGWVMWPLLVFSVLTWSVVLERAFVFLTLRPRIRRLGNSLKQTLQSGDLASAKQLCIAEKPIVAEIFLPSVDTKRKREQAERVTDRNRVKLTGYLKKNLWILGTIGTSSPFIGLLGTVVGIVRAFHDMAEKGAGGFSVVAAGISEALIATAAGLIVAIVSLLTYNIFINATNTLITQIKVQIDELMDQSYDGAKAAS
jgi:biopolymer transport protein ExbB